MTMPAVPRIPPPLATDADTATGHAGTCAICQGGILSRQRYALLTHSGKPAHLSCIGLMAARLGRGTVPVIR
jgi:hypothetical protein